MAANEPDRAWLDDEGDASSLWTILTTDPDAHFAQEGIPLWPMTEEEAEQWIAAIRAEAVAEVRSGG